MVFWDDNEKIFVILSKTVPGFVVDKGWTEEKYEIKFLIEFCFEKIDKKSCFSRICWVDNQSIEWNVFWTDFVIL